MRGINNVESAKCDNSLDPLVASIYVVVFYNRTAQQLQSIQFVAANKFRAGRDFYRQYKGKARIELIHKVKVQFS